MRSKKTFLNFEEIFDYAISEEIEADNLDTS